MDIWTTVNISQSVYTNIVTNQLSLKASNTLHTGIFSVTREAVDSWNVEPPDERDWLKKIMNWSILYHDFFFLFQLYLITCNIMLFFCFSSLKTCCTPLWRRKREHVNWRDWYKVQTVTLWMSNVQVIMDYCLWNSPSIVLIMCNILLMN